MVVVVWDGFLSVLPAKELMQKFHKTADSLIDVSNDHDAISRREFAKETYK